MTLTTQGKRFFALRIINIHEFNFSNAVSGDLLGLSTPPTSQPNAGNTGVLLDVLGDIYSGKQTNAQAANLYNPKKYFKHRNSYNALHNKNLF